MKTPSFLLVTAMMTQVLLAEPSVELVSIEEQASSPPSAIVPWVNEQDRSWRQGEPTFRIASDQADPAASGWIAVSDQAILLHVVVQDKEHLAKQTGNDIWDGDGVQIGVDALAEGAPGRPADAQYVGPHTASIAVALTRNGPEAWAHHHGRPGGAGAMDRLKPAIVRDEAAGTTTYDIRLPWNEFQATGGVRARFALAVQVNDHDTGRRTGISWGEGAGWCQPNLFRTIQIGPPPSGWAGIAVERSALVRQGESGQVALAVAVQRPAVVSVQIGQFRKQVDLPAAAKGGETTRARLLLTPGGPVDPPVPVQVAIAFADGETLAKAEFDLVDAGQPVRALRQALESKAVAADQPLLKRHFASVDALFAVDWAAAVLDSDTNPQPAAKCAAFARSVQEALQSPTHDWPVYGNGRRSMVMAFRSATDNTLEFYLLTLPRNWDQQTAYPVIIFLHGRADPHPLNFVSGALVGEPSEGVSADEPASLLIQPWGRGNAGYWGIGGTDVGEAAEDLARTVKVDGSRIYLAGHSMGGGGTWSLGLTNPDRVAAIAVCAGGPWWAPVGAGLGQNLRNVPVMIWHGDADGAVPVGQAYAMQKDLVDNGVTPVMQIIPGRGHNMTGEDMAMVRRWLLQQPARQRSNGVSFVGYGPDQLRAYGVTMRYAPHLSATPRFSYRVEGGNVVHLTSSGTESLRIELGDQGLGLSGNVVVIWNGEKAYEGPARGIRLPIERADE
jgi:pimeloyl-ACP methyl ester carboxylesterase